ncbi:MAG: hypothetical protein KJN99_04590 [Marinicaulis sp.]|nr:hypothetical protein [Marinicaulis sp.]
MLWIIGGLPRAAILIGVYLVVPKRLAIKNYKAEIRRAALGYLVIE